MVLLEQLYMGTRFLLKGKGSAVARDRGQGYEARKILAHL